MSTTTLFVELLLSGLEALVWIFFLIGLVFGTDWLSSLVVVFEKAEILTTTIIIGIAYFIGIVVEEVSDAVITPLARRMIPVSQKKNWDDFYDMQAFVYSHAQKESIAPMEYMRSRRRILRAAIFNVVFVVIFSILFILSPALDTNISKASLVLFVSATGILILASTIFAYGRIYRLYVVSLQLLYKSIKK